MRCVRRGAAVPALGDRPSLPNAAARGSSIAERAAEMIEQDPSLGKPLIVGLPYLRAEAIFAVQFEMARTLDDILSRRTRARIINRRASVASARNVAELIAPYLDWSEQEINNQVLAYCDSCADEDHAALKL